MAAPKGNQFWMARSRHGNKPIFKDSEILWDACCEYFQWAEDNPLTEAIVFQGQVTGNKNLMRAMTESGMCIFLDIPTSTWDNYKHREGFLEVTTRVSQIIYNQKFAGASADLLNANIIARDLGLADKKETKLSGYVGLKEITDMTDDELQNELDANG